MFGGNNWLGNVQCNCCGRSNGWRRTLNWETALRNADVSFSTFNRLFARRSGATYAHDCVPQQSKGQLASYPRHCCRVRQVCVTEKGCKSLKKTITKWSSCSSGGKHQRAEGTVVHICDALFMMMMYFFVFIVHSFCNSKTKQKRDKTSTASKPKKK